MTSFARRCLVNSFYFLCVFFVTYGNESSKTSKGGLPFCGLAESSSRYIFVSTLDGKLTALNPNDDGSVLWSIHPGSESMLSSSIHKLELSNYGHLVRMIPSLSGGLYKFNGENIEVIPVTAENLLQSSFRYSDDLVISGGKEIRTFGVSLQSGRIIYECSMKGCGNVSRSTDSGEVLVIQRLGQVVRAVEPRTGTEKWNFSVAQHDLKLLTECHSTQSTDLNYNLKVIVPEGVIYATDSKNPSHVMWKHKFSSPVVSAWQLHKGKLVEVDLFNGYQSVFESVVPPSIYIGMHGKQLYIQESVIMLKRRQEIAAKAKQRLIGTERNYPRIPWKPVSASSSTDLISTEAQNGLDDASQRQTTALSVLYASPYVDGSGFYLYTEDELDKVKKGSCNASVEEINIREDDSDSDFLSESNDISDFESASDDIPDIQSTSDDGSDFHSPSEGVSNVHSTVEDISFFANEFSEANTPVEIVIVSFWYYWKEVLVISITTALLCNLMITRTYLRWKMKGVSKSSEESKSSGAAKETDSGLDMTLDKTSRLLELGSNPDYTSRYLADFDPVACLGRGGFGVVFEAKNKIDDCHYAIKRILLPSKVESRERVMREVKALAKLDHHHIVRYFNAWTECPPAGWQENYDKTWIDITSDNLTFNGTISSLPTTINTDNTRKSSVFLNVDSLYPPNRVESLRGSLNSDENDISDSFIVFDDGGQTSEPDKTRDKSKRGSIVNINSGTEDSCKSSAKILSKSERPKSLLLDQRSSPESQNLSKVYLYIQMQLCQKQSLRDWLTVNKERDYDTVLNIFEQILQAVEHIHLNELIHRDLKPSNIFFSLDNQIKVGDFGLVTAMTEGDIQMSPTENVPADIQSEKHTAQVGTQLYMSQEQLLGKAYNYKVDIYSLGLILFELLVPFTTQMERVHVLQDIKNDKFPDTFQKDYKKEHELLRLMLSHSPDERPTTFGIRAMLPLKQEPVDESWHFDLPMRRRAYSKTYHYSTSSNEGTHDS